MTSKQRVVIIAGTLTIVVMALFPPWLNRYEAKAGGRAIVYLGYSLIFRPPIDGLAVLSAFNERFNGEPLGTDELIKRMTWGGPLALERFVDEERTAKQLELEREMPDQLVKDSRDMQAITKAMHRFDIALEIDTTRLGVQVGAVSTLTFLLVSLLGTSWPRYRPILIGASLVFLSVAIPPWTDNYNWKFSYAPIYAPPWPREIVAEHTVAFFNRVQIDQARLGIQLGAILILTAGLMAGFQRKKCKA